MKKMIKMMGIIFTSIALASCKTPELVVETTVTDSFGREVTFKDSDTERVVCLGAGALRMYSYVGDMSKLVGVEKIDKETFGVGTAIRPYYHVNKDLFATLPLVGQGGPAAQAPELETLASVNPTMVITCYSNIENVNSIVNTLHIPVIAIKQGADGPLGDEFGYSIGLLGLIFNRVERASALLNYVSGVREDLHGRAPEEVKSVYMGCIGNWGKTNAYGTMTNNPILSYAHVNNAADLYKGESKAQFSIDQEKLVSLNPEKIFLDAAGYAGFKSDYDEHPENYTVLDAFKNNEVYNVLPFKAYDGNLEIQLMSTYFVGKTVYPELYSDVDLTAKYNEILYNFLGKRCYSEFSSYSTWNGGYAKISLD